MRTTSDDDLAADFRERVRRQVRQSLAAGCDLVLHCNGNLAEMEDVAAACPELAGAALERAERALASRCAAEPIDLREARARFAALLAREQAVTA